MSAIEEGDAALRVKLIKNELNGLLWCWWRTCLRWNRLDTIPATAHLYNLQRAW